MVPNPVELPVFVAIEQSAEVNLYSIDIQPFYVLASPHEAGQLT
jgi:hypothetical protein